MRGAHRLHASILSFQKKRGLWHTPKQSDRQYYKMQESFNKLSQELHKRITKLTKQSNRRQKDNKSTTSNTPSLKYHFHKQGY
mgnify:CR=1 FL=1